MALLIYTYKGTRTPLLPKLDIGLAIEYMLSSIDLIPDFVPKLGLLNDLIIVPLLIKLSINLIPAVVLIQPQQNLKIIRKYLRKTNG